MVQKLKKFWKWYIGVILSLFVFYVATPVFAYQPIVESSCVSGCGRIFLKNESPRDYQVAQKFTPSVSTSITSVVFPVSVNDDTCTGTSNLYAYIYTWTSATNPATTLLGTSTNYLVLADLDMASPPTPRTFYFDSIPVTAGNNYSIVIKTSDDDYGGCLVTVPGNNSATVSTKFSVRSFDTGNWGEDNLYGTYGVYAGALTADEIIFPNKYFWQWKVPLIYNTDYIYDIHTQNIKFQSATNQILRLDLNHEALSLSAYPAITFKKYTSATFGTVDTTYTSANYDVARVTATKTSYGFYVGDTVTANTYYWEFSYAASTGETATERVVFVVDDAVAGQGYITKHTTVSTDYCSDWTGYFNDLCKFFSISPGFFESKIGMIQTTLNTKFAVVPQIANTYSYAVTALSNAPTNAPSFNIAAWNGVHSGFVWSPFSSMADYMPTVRNYMSIGLILYVLILLIQRLPSIFKDHTNDSDSTFSQYSPKMNMTKKEWRAQPNVKPITQSYARFKGIK